MTELEIVCWLHVILCFFIFGFLFGYKFGYHDGMIQSAKQPPEGGTNGIEGDGSP